MLSFFCLRMGLPGGMGPVLVSTADVLPCLLPLDDDVVYVHSQAAGCLSARPRREGHLYACSAAVWASRCARRARLSRMVCFRSSRIVFCLSSTPCSQYPKLAPAPAKTGYAHSEPRLKKGRISRPSCQKRTATPGEEVNWSELGRHTGDEREGEGEEKKETRTARPAGPSWKQEGWRTEAGPEEDSVNHGQGAGI